MAVFKLSSILKKTVLISAFGTFNLLFSFSKITNWKLYLGRKWRTETSGSGAVFSIFSEWMLLNQFGSWLSIIQHCFQFLLGRLLVPLRNVFGGTTKSIMVFLKKDLLIKSKSVFILGDPGADSGGEGKSKRAEKYGSKKSKEKARRAPGDNVLPDQFSTVTAVLASDWCQKTFVFFWTLSWAVTSPRETRLP